MAPFKLKAQKAWAVLSRFIFLHRRVLFRNQSEEALIIIKDNLKNLDMAIIDMDMPGLDGLELSKVFCGDRPELPIILCTGYDHRQWDLQHEEVDLFNRVLV